MSHRRETIIALRARHAAFRMAMAILHPPPPRPAPPVLRRSATADSVPAIDVMAQFASWERHERRERRDRRMRRLAVLLWTATIVVAAWNWLGVGSRRPSPPPGQPPPQARPILPAR